LFNQQQNNHADLTFEITLSITKMTNLVVKSRSSVAAPPTYFRRTMDTFEFSEHDEPLPPARATSTPGLKKKAQRESKKAEREAQNRNKKVRSAAATEKQQQSKPKKLHIK
jgi:electron transfer flavoprotein alpha subunit